MSDSQPLARVLTAALLIGCTPSAPPASPVSESTGPEPAASLAGTAWTLVELEGAPAQLGAGNRPVTLIFAAAEARAGGFAGCNRYSGGYEVDGQSLAFGPIVMTRMAGTSGMELETRLSGALGATRSFDLAAAALTFRSDGAVVARFRPAAPADTAQ